MCSPAPNGSNALIASSILTTLPAAQSLHQEKSGQVQSGTEVPYASFEAAAFR